MEKLLKSKDAKASMEQFTKKETKLTREFHEDKSKFDKENKAVVDIFADKE